MDPKGARRSCRDRDVASLCDDRESETEHSCFIRQSRPMLLATEVEKVTAMEQGIRRGGEKRG